MGMDVYGRNPRSDPGEYFQANVWSWRPIHALIVELCSDLLDEDTIEHLGYNAGAGPKDQRTCTEMARRFEVWVEQHTDGHKLDLDLRVTKEGRFISEDELAENPEMEIDSPYEVSDDHLKEWIEFLRNCGGFEVR